MIGLSFLREGNKYSRSCIRTCETQGFERNVARGWEPDKHYFGRIGLQSIFGLLLLYWTKMMRSLAVLTKAYKPYKAIRSQDPGSLESFCSFEYAAPGDICKSPWPTDGIRSKRMFIWPSIFREEVNDNFLLSFPFL